MQLEKTYFDLAAMSRQNCLVICDGGTMDVKARKCLVLHSVAAVCQVCHMPKTCPTSLLSVSGVQVKSTSSSFSSNSVE